MSEPQVALSALHQTEPHMFVFPFLKPWNLCLAHSFQGCHLNNAHSILYACYQLMLLFQVPLD